MAKTEPALSRSHARSSGPAGPAAIAGPAALSSRRNRDLKERLIGAVLFLCAAISTLVTVGIVAVLLGESLLFFREVSLVDFLTDTRWTPLFQDPHFGILPLAAGSFLVAVGAAIIAIPVGLLTAIFLSEYAGDRLRGILKPLLEILAGIPTDIFNAAAGAIVVGIMIIPTVASLSEDALRAVPDALRQGAYGLGATKMEVSTRVVVPGALSGIIASFILGISRAIGETMAVTIASGNMPNLTLNPLESIQTMTAYIVQVSKGDTPHGTIEYQTLFAVGLTLFVITLLMNILSQWVLARFREEYQ